MKIALNYDTSTMTKQERLNVRDELQSVLDQLNHELKTEQLAKRVHDNSNTFFGVNLDLANMSSEQLSEAQSNVRSLLSCISMWAGPFDRKPKPVQTFFDLVFNFERMSKEDLDFSKREARRLLSAIIREKTIREKLNRSAESPAKV